MNKNKLELTWIGKEDEISLEPRLLIENFELSYGDKDTKNMIIQGDNLLALKALEEFYTGAIKCVYIDPPYNTGNAFEHYDDGIEHSLWLSLMKKRLEILHKLLSKDGSIWISIDDDECHYLKVLCDEIFGRQNFINNVIWEKKYTVANDAKWLSDNHDHILVYAKNKETWRPNRLPRSEEMDKAYKNPDNHPKGIWKATPLHAKSGAKDAENFEYTFLNDRTWIPPVGTFHRFSKETLKRLDENNEIWFGKDGKAIPSRKTFMCDLKNDGVPSRTLWRYDEVGHNHEARTEVKAFNADEIFATPKPERLLQRILILATNEGDLVLDSFLGSGTTTAVAQKMNRQYIGIELGGHAITHCVPRMKMVVNGEQDGISKIVNWKGGGGFKFYTLAPSLLTKDKFDNWVIDPSYDANLLASAVAKQENFIYHPNNDFFWKQGYSTENDYIYTTTQFVTVELLDKIHDDMNEGESLLVCSKTFQEACKDRYSNITLKKIPLVLLGKCEFGKNDYSLNVTEEAIGDDDE